MSASPSPLAALAPGIFVVLWSTGFIAAKAGLPFAPPLTFLALRFALVVAIALALASILRAPWPGPIAALHIAVVGVLMHGAYLGGVFMSIDRGLPAGLSALIVGLQPLLTAFAVGPLLGERVTARQWLGFVAGLAGTVLVLHARLDFTQAEIGAVLLSALALVGITAGTLYQKRFCGQADLRSGAVVQYAAALIVVGGLAILLETPRVEFAPPFVVALLWLTVVLSVGAVTLLYWLIRQGAAAKTASLFYLVPPFAALFAWTLFGETLTPLGLAGMALAAAGVALVQKG